MKYSPKTKIKRDNSARIVRAKADPYADAPEVVVSGVVERVFYERGTFSAGVIRTKDGRVTFSGSVTGATSGQQISVSGKWVDDPKYGRQFRVESVVVAMPDDVEGLEAYITNCPAMVGIGPSRARRLATTFAADWENALENRAEEMASVAGCSVEVIRRLRAVWNERKDANGLMTQLSAYGLTYGQAAKIAEILGGNAAVVLKNDPYRLIDLIDGFAFKRVDEIARRVGCSKDLPGRIAAGILHCVSDSENSGNCWLEEEELLQRANTLLILDRLDSLNVIEAEIDRMVEQRRLIRYDIGGQHAVGSSLLFSMERLVWASIRKLLDRAGWCERIALNAPITDPTGRLNIDQDAALISSFSNSLSLITGGAGTGKTFTISVICDIAEGLGLKIALCAPTGKAARRMEEGTGRPALTIHRLLGCDGKTWEHNHDNPIDADVLIVDECSMIDVPLAWRLFNAIDTDRTSVVMVGDAHQLPPVGPGSVFRDMLLDKAIPKVVLKECVRQTGILKRNCNDILKGQVNPTVKEDDGFKLAPWYVFSNLSEPQAVESAVRDLFVRQFEVRFKYDLTKDVQVVTPTHKGPIGTSALNIMIQRIIQEKRGVEIEQQNPLRRPLIYPGDKVIQTRNNYDIGLMNGMIGFVEDVTKDAYFISFDGETVEIPKKKGEWVNDLNLAYALTIHKTQGSEFPCVVVICHKSHSFQHHRNLLYTAVTRSKERTIILGDAWGIRNCAARVSNNARQTWLSQFCAGVIE